MKIPAITGIIRRRLLVNYRIAPEVVKGIIRYSSREDSCRLDGLLLKVPEWKVSPLSAQHVRSAYYDDPSIFPPEAIHFDHALLMRDIPHEWHSEPEMRVVRQG